MRSARSGSSLMAKMPAVGAGHEAVVDGQLVGQVAPLGHLDGVDLADEVGDRRVGGGELLAEALVAVDPFDRGGVAVLGDEVAGVAGHGMLGIVVDLAAGDDRDPVVEQLDQRADHAGLRLAPLPQEDDVVARQHGVLELREDGLVEADHRGDELLAGGDAVHGVAADLVLDRHRAPARRPELSQGGGTGGVRPHLPLLLLRSGPLGPRSLSRFPSPRDARSCWPTYRRADRAASRGVRRSGAASTPVRRPRSRSRADSRR